MNIFAYHLPLDALPLYGNNEPVLTSLGCENIELFEEIGFMGFYPEPLTASSYIESINRYYDFEATHIIPGDKTEIKGIAVVSGDGTSFFRKAITHNRLNPVKKIDAFITGESTEWIYSLAKENSIAYSAIGHNRSEEVGPALLGRHLAEKFKLEFSFIKEDNPF